MPTLMLIDTAGLYFRAFYGVPDSVRSPAGEPVNALRGTFEALAALVRNRRPDRLVACWDTDWRPAWRAEAVPSYKAHRARPDGTEEVPAALERQIPLVAEALAAFGIARLGAPGLEADDVIATLATRERARPDPAEVEIVTGDRDLFQLVGPGVRVLYTARGLRNLEIVDEARLAEKYGVASGRAYGDLAILRGDASDGLPGVPGIGEATAAGLLGRFGTLEAVLAARDAGDPALAPVQRRRLLDAAAYLEVAPRVVRVVTEADLPEVEDLLPAAPADPAAVLAFAERWGLAGSATRLVAALTEAAAR